MPEPFSEVRSVIFKVLMSLTFFFAMRVFFIYCYYYYWWISYVYISLFQGFIRDRDLVEIFCVF